MHIFSAIVLLAAVLEVIFALPPAHIPKICIETPPFADPPPDCCEVPPMFALAHLYNCGFPEQWEMLFEKKVMPSRICPKYQCLAKKYNLLADAEIYPEAVIDFLNDYSKKHPKFLSAVSNAKRKCVGKKLPGMETCPTEKILACIARTMIFVMSMQRENKVVRPLVFLKQCLKLPPKSKNLNKCCMIPPLFSDEELATCGLSDVVSHLSQRVPVNYDMMCAKNTCVLKRASLMIDKTIIDITQVNPFLDKYTAKYPMFEDVMPAIKGRCVGTEMAYVAGCPTVKLVGCLLSMMAFHCPQWNNRTACVKYRSYIGLCSPFHLTID